MLGSGAFSTCFQARDVETGTLMAVKQIQLNRTGLQNEEEKVNVFLHYYLPSINSLFRTSVHILFRPLMQLPVAVCLGKQTRN